MKEDSTANYAALMRRCIELGSIAKQRGESPVGALLALDGEVIAEGIESVKAKSDITCHAEVEAIRNALQTAAAADLANCVLVTTHEPCIMCSYVIRHYRIATVAFAIATGEIGGCTSNLPVLTDTSIQRWAAPPVILPGILEDECRRLLN